MANIILNGINDRYQFDPDIKSSFIGKGGMGIVFKGTALKSQISVAIKVLYRELTDKESNIERARREAAVQIQHPNLLRMLDFVEVNGIFHIISEYLAGETLDKRIQTLTKLDEVLSFTETKRILNSILDGVERLHQHDPQIIHRDIDPSNIMLCSNGDVKLMDFGVVKVSDDTKKKLTSMGVLVGKPYYSAPEQIRNTASDITNESTDIYAIGINCYQMLTGQVPFDGASEYDILEKQMKDPLPQHAKIPHNVYCLLVNATQKEQKYRYKTIADFREDLNRLPESKIKLLKHENILKKLQWFKIGLYTTLLALIGSNYYYWDNYVRYKGKSQQLDATLNITTTHLDNTKANLATTQQNFDASSKRYADSMTRYRNTILDLNKKITDNDANLVKIKGIVEKATYDYPIEIYGINIKNNGILIKYNSLIPENKSISFRVKHFTYYKNNSYSLYYKNTYSISMDASGNYATNQEFFYGWSVQYEPSGTVDRFELWYNNICLGAKDYGK